MNLAILVAHSKNRVIGRGGSLPWRLPNDFKRVKSLTQNNAIIMGRKTYDSIGKPLPNRQNIVISRNKKLKISGCDVAHSIDSAIEIVNPSVSAAFIFGGETLYKQALSKVEKLYLTIVDTEIAGDTFFPEIDYANWILEEKVSFEHDESHEYNYEFLTYSRKI